MPFQKLGVVVSLDRAGQRVCGDQRSPCYTGRWYLKRLLGLISHLLAGMPQKRMQQPYHGWRMRRASPVCGLFGPRDRGTQIIRGRRWATTVGCVGVVKNCRQPGRDKRAGPLRRSDLRESSVTVPIVFSSVVEFQPPKG